MKKRVVIVGKYRQVRLTEWAKAKLESVRLRLCEEIKDNPYLFPGYAGRRITLSDVVCILCERASNEG